MGAGAGKQFQSDKAKHAQAVLSAVQKFEQESEYDDHLTARDGFSTDFFKRRVLLAATDAKLKGNDIEQSLAQLSDADLETLAHYVEKHGREGKHKAGSAAKARGGGNGGGHHRHQQMEIMEVEEVNDDDLMHNSHHSRDRDSLTAAASRTNASSSGEHHIHDAADHADNVDETTSVLSYGDEVHDNDGEDTELDSMSGSLDMHKNASLTHDTDDDIGGSGLYNENDGDGGTVTGDYSMNGSEFKISAAASSQQAHHNADLRHLGAKTSEDTKSRIAEAVSKFLDLEELGSIGSQAGSTFSPMPHDREGFSIHPTTDQHYKDRGQKIDERNAALMGLQRQKVITLTQNAQLEREVEALQRQLDHMEQMDSLNNTAHSHARTSSTVDAGSGIISPLSSGAIVSPSCLHGADFGDDLHSKFSSDGGHCAIKSHGRIHSDAGASNSNWKPKRSYIYPIEEDNTNQRIAVKSGENDAAVAKYQRERRQSQRVAGGRADGTGAKEAKLSGAATDQPNQSDAAERGSRGNRKSVARGGQASNGKRRGNRQSNNRHMARSGSSDSENDSNSVSSDHAHGGSHITSRAQEKKGRASRVGALAAANKNMHLNGNGDVSDFSEDGTVPGGKDRKSEQRSPMLALQGNSMKPSSTNVSPSNTNVLHPGVHNHDSEAKSQRRGVGARRRDLQRANSHRVGGLDDAKHQAGGESDESSGLRPHASVLPNHHRVAAVGDGSDGAKSDNCYVPSGVKDFHKIPADAKHLDSDNELKSRHGGVTGAADPDDKVSIIRRQKVKGKRRASGQDEESRVSMDGKISRTHHVNDTDGSNESAHSDAALNVMGTGYRNSGGPGMAVAAQGGRLGSQIEDDPLQQPVAPRMKRERRLSSFCDDKHGGMASAAAVAAAAASKSPPRDDPQKVEEDCKSLLNHIEKHMGAAVSKDKNESKDAGKEFGDQGDAGSTDKKYLGHRVGRGARASVGISESGANPLKKLNRRRHSLDSAGEENDSDGSKNKKGDHSVPSRKRRHERRTYEKGAVVPVIGVRHAEGVDETKDALSSHPEGGSSGSNSPSKEAAVSSAAPASLATQRPKLDISVVAEAHGVASSLSAANSPTAAGVQQQQRVKRRRNRVPSDVSTNKQKKDIPAVIEPSQETADPNRPWTSHLEHSWAEVSLLLRKPINSEEDMLYTVAAAEAGLMYIDQMDQIAKTLNVLRGSLSRWLLPFDNNTRIDSQCSTPHSVVESMPAEFRGKLTERQVHYLVAGANGVRKLVRIKIADDNDLEQARNAVKTIDAFFKALYARAKSGGTQPYALLRSGEEGIS